MQIEIKDRLGLNLKKCITCIVCQRDVSERPIILVHCGLHGLSLLFVLHFYSFLSLIVSQSRECVLIFPGFVSLRFFLLFVCSPPLALPSLTHTCCLELLATVTCSTCLAAPITCLSWEWVTMATT